jgi:hypothetical protein
LNAGRRFRIANDLIDAHSRVIGALSVAVYTVLARHAYHATGEGVVTVVQIARALDMTRSEATAGLYRLIDASLIAMTEPEKYGNGSRQFHYRLLDPSPDAVSARFTAKAKRFEYTPSLQRE